MGKASEGYKSQLRQKIADVLPPEMNSVETQRNVLYMVETVAPMVSACRKHAEEFLWPKVKSGETTIQSARKQCAVYLNKLAGITIVENLKLERHSQENLMKAWMAMDSYAQQLKPEESVKLLMLMDEVAAVLEEKERGGRASGQQTAEMDMSTVPIDTSKVIIPNLDTVDNGGASGADGQGGTGEDTDLRERRRPNPLVLAIVAVLVVAVAVVGISIAWKQVQINKVEDAIAQIGEVTMESSGAIKNAELAYDELSEEQQAEVENHETLTEARAEYDRLDKLVQDAKDAIADIGKVTLNSGSKIQKARKAYDALEADGLTGYAEEEYKTLTDAEAEFEKIYAEDLYNDGLALFEEKKYDEALTKFDEIAEDYPKHSRASSAKTYAAKCMVIKAQESFDKAEYESAMTLLTDGREKYGDSAENKELTDKLVKKLESMRPINGKKYKEGIAWGYGKLAVTADDKDVIVKIVSETDPQEYMLFYVRAGQTYEVSLKNGDYKVLFGTGEYWYGDKNGFGQEGEYKEVNKTYSYTSVREGAYVYYNARKLDLTGKVDTTDVTYDQFWN